MVGGGGGGADCSQATQSLHGRGNVAFIVGAMGNIEGYVCMYLFI